jgi:integrase
MAKLTDAAVLKKRPHPDKRLEIHDASGLYLVIQPSGAKSWAYRYRYVGKSRKLTIGSFPSMDLANARARAAAEGVRVQGGADPATEHRVASTAADDFATVAVQFIQRYAKPKNRGWKETARLVGLIPDPTAPSEDPATFVAHKDGAVKKWGHRKIADITRADINRHLDGIVDRGSPIAANRVFAALRKLFGWAETRYALAANPCDRVERPSAEVSRDRILSDDELRSVWAAAGELDWPFGPFVHLLALTGQRLNEVAGMSWSELDLEKRLWTLPRGRVKNDKGHEVPLSAQAIKVIKSVPKVGGRDLLFSTTGTSPISGFSKTKATVDEKSSVTEWTFHDLRRTLASGMARLGINLPVIEKVLNHSSGSFRGIVGIYQRHSFADEKRHALDAWGAHVMRIVKGQADNVVALRG